MAIRSSRKVAAIQKSLQRLFKRGLITIKVSVASGDARYQNKTYQAVLARGEGGSVHPKQTPSLNGSEGGQPGWTAQRPPLIPNRVAPRQSRVDSSKLVGSHPQNPVLVRKVPRWTARSSPREGRGTDRCRTERFRIQLENVGLNFTKGEAVKRFASHWPNQFLITFIFQTDGIRHRHSGSCSRKQTASLSKIFFNRHRSSAIVSALGNSVRNAHFQ